MHACRTTISTASKIYQVHVLRAIACFRKMPAIGTSRARQADATPVCSLKIQAVRKMEVPSLCKKICSSCTTDTTRQDGYSVHDITLTEEC